MDSNMIHCIECWVNTIFHLTAQSGLKVYVVDKQNFLKETF